MPNSPLTADGEKTSQTTTVGIIQYQMPVGFVTIVTQNKGGADVEPDVGSSSEK